MKKRVISFSMAIMMLFCTSITVFAVDNSAAPRASHYLDSYFVSLGAKGGGRMLVSMSVDGVGVQDKIGVSEVSIMKKVNGSWSYVESLDAVDHPEFWNYNSRDYLGDVSFYGTPGDTYCVELTVYASSGAGSDTGYITSPAVVCK